VPPREIWESHNCHGQQPSKRIPQSYAFSLPWGSPRIIHDTNGKTLQEKLSQLPQERQDRIKQQAGLLIAEELSLRDLRLARQLTQEKLGEKLQIRQESISRLEQRSDLHLSTLREVIQAMEGELRLVVEFPDRAPILLSGFQGNEIIDN